MENLPLAINLTFVGITVVFIALILLSLIIYVSTRLLTLKRNGRTESNNKLHKASILEIDEASILEIDDDEEEIINIQGSKKPDEELVAIIMAAIQAGMSPDSQCRLQIKSFRRIEQTSPIWNKAGRREQIANKL